MLQRVNNIPQYLDSFSFSSLEMLNLTSRAYISVKNYISNREMRSRHSTRDCEAWRSSAIILITFFRSNRFTYVKLHSRLLHYAVHTSKQVAEDALHGPLSSVERVLLWIRLADLPENLSPVPRAYVISTSR